MMSCVFKEHFPRFVGAAFTFPLEPEARHRLAVAIKKEEKKRHGKDWRTCVRRKAGSTKASAIFLDSIDPPGCLKRVTYKVDKVIRELTDPLEHEPDTWYGRLWNRVKQRMVNGGIPLFKTTAFIFDYVKDFFLFLYVLSKRAFIASKFLKGLINFYGATILTSGVLMGLSIQFDGTVVKLDRFIFPKFTWVMRFLIFIATPIMPVVVILQAMILTTKKRKLESEWVKKQENICKLYLKHNQLDKEKRKVMKALADMKMVEVSTEAVPQMGILIVLIIFSSRLVDCPTQLTLYDLDLSVVFHDKYQ